MRAQHQAARIRLIEQVKADPVVPRNVQMDPFRYMLHERLSAGGDAKVLKFFYQVLVWHAHTLSRFGTNTKQFARYKGNVT